MDFLKNASEKLGLEENLPSEIRDKLPGHGGQGQGQGSHLAQANQGPGDRDGPGFPEGLRPEDWMGDLVAKNLFPADAPVTHFRFPGSHDAATYGSGLESFSYQCQEKNFYEQMRTGQRAFDLRLAPSENGKFMPVHGIAKHTADDFNSGPHDAQPGTLAAQIMRFAKEHPKEILLFQCRVEGFPQAKHDFAEAVMNILGPRLLEAPEQGRPLPTYQQAVQSNRNIIFAVGEKWPNHPVGKYIWHIGGDSLHWMADGDQLLWNEPIWQSGEVTKVIGSVEEFMQKNKDKAARREKFWVAYLQLTPVLGQNFTTFVKEGGSIRPRDLALGGGIGTHGQFQGSNKTLRESGVFKKPLWRNHASCLLYDFCDIHTTGQIVAMNIRPGA